MTKNLNHSYRMAGVISAAFLFILPFANFQTPQVFSDLICGLSAYDANISMQNGIYKVMLIMAAMALWIIAYKTKKRQQGTHAGIILTDLSAIYLVTMVICTTWGLQIKPVMAAIFLTVAILSKSNPLEALAEMCLSYMATRAVVLVLTTIAALHGDFIQGEIGYISALTLTFPVYFVFTIGKQTKWQKSSEIRYKKCLSWICMGNILPILSPYYKTADGLETVINNPGFYVFVSVFMAVCIGINCKAKSAGILPGSTAMCYCLASSVSPLRTVPIDAWHHGEQMAAYFQILKGQQLYTDYFPASGCHPVLTGFIMDIFLDGTLTSYKTAQMILTFIFAAVISILVYRITNENIAFIIAVSAGLARYNRCHMVMLVALILLQPEIIQNSGKWMRTYIIGMLAAGLYYPTTAVALCIPCLPFFVASAADYIKNGIYRKQPIKEAIFWSITLAPCFASMPIMIRMARYILMQTSTSLMIEGMPIFNNVLSYNMSLSKMQDIKELLLLSERIFLLTAAVLIPIHVACVYFKKEGFFLSLKERQPFSLGISIASVFLPIYMQYTLIKADSNTLMARSFVGIYLSSVVLLCVTFAYNRDSLSATLQRAIKKWTILSLVLMAIVQFDCYFMDGISDSMKSVLFDACDTYEMYADLCTDDAKKNSKNTFLRINENDYPNVGRGYWTTQTKNQTDKDYLFLKETGLINEKIVNLPRTELVGLDMTCAALEQTSIARGYTSESFFVDKMLQEDAVFRYIEPIFNYYQRRMLKDAGYRELKNGYFVSEEMVEKHGLSGYIKENTYHKWYDLEFVPSALGKSIGSLNDRIEKKEELTQYSTYTERDGWVYIDIVLPETVRGTKVDLLYMAFDFIDNKKSFPRYYPDSNYNNRVTIHWDTKDVKNAGTIAARYGNGILLMQMGVLDEWLESDVTEIHIKIRNTASQGIGQLKEISSYTTIY